MFVYKYMHMTCVTESIVCRGGSQWCCEAPTVPNSGQTPTLTPKENVGVTIYTYPSKNVLFMLIIMYFAERPKWKGLTCAEFNLNSC